MVVSCTKIDTVIPDGGCVSNHTPGFETPFESPLFCVKRVECVICGGDVHRAIGNDRTRLDWSPSLIFPKQLERRFECPIRAPSREVQIVHEHGPIFRTGRNGGNNRLTFRLGFR